MAGRKALDAVHFLNAFIFSTQCFPYSWFLAMITKKTCQCSPLCMFMHSSNIVCKNLYMLNSVRHLHYSFNHDCFAQYFKNHELVPTH